MEDGDVFAKDRDLEHVNLFICLNFLENNQLEDPRVQWRQEQEHMLTEYLVTAQEDLEVS